MNDDPATASLQHLANKVNDHSTVLQAIQVEMGHISKGIDRLVGVSEKQAVLGSELQRHSESIDRAFKQMDAHKSDLTDAIRELADSFKTHSGNQSGMKNEIEGFKGSIRALRWAGGGLLVLLSAIGTLLLGNLRDGQARVESAVTSMASDFERRKLAVDIKIDTLSQQVQEVRLDRQRDRETVEDKKP